MKCVIDASTAFQWEVPEPDSLKAIQLREDYRNGIHELISPDIFPAEVGNALVVAERKGRIVAGQFAVRLPAILAFCPDLHDTRPLIHRACYIIASVATGFRLSSMRVRYDVPGAPNFPVSFIFRCGSGTRACPGADHAVAPKSWHAEKTG